jgi:hypothetical protein
LLGAAPLVAQAPPDSRNREGEAPAELPAPRLARQEPDPPETAPSGKDSKTADASSDRTNAAPFAPVDTFGSYRFWVRAEYRMWWVKDAPLPVPIVTTGDPHVGFDPNMVHTVNTAGAIGQSGTQVLLGDHGLSFPQFSGMGITLGAWIDENNLFGVEGEGFFLERHTENFAVASDRSGNPPLYFPIFSSIAGAERGIPIADPLRSFSGDVLVNSSLRLWGAEVNGVLVLFRNLDLEFTFLTGFRYADLRETLQIYNTTTDLTFGNVTKLTDLFDTRNQFYGGQIGGRLAVQRYRCSLDITGKVALGSTHQVVDIQGAITQAGPNPPTPPGLGTFPGGLFTQLSNIGRRDANQFTVLPSLELNVGYQIKQHIRAYVGYDVMYWNQVARPGDQIDHNVNLTQNRVLDPNGTGRLLGAAQPAPLFNHSDFWAQGINFGLEFRY